MTPNKEWERFVDRVFFFSWEKKTCKADKTVLSSLLKFSHGHPPGSVIYSIGCRMGTHGDNGEYMLITNGRSSYFTHENFEEEFCLDGRTYI